MSFEFRRMGSKLIRRTGYHIVPTIAHFCPACGGLHDYAVEKPFHNGAKWTFNGNAEKPDFTPSMNITGRPGGYCCHYYVTSGSIIYQPDCSHAMKGKTVPLPDIPERCLIGNDELV